MNSSKFDRQLILWGEEGQHRIEDASICIIGSDLLACEIAKGLLLTNCLQLVIIDPGAEETSSDDGQASHFYHALHPNPNGLTMLNVVAQVLQKFNESAKISTCSESLEHLFEGDRHFFDQFSLVVTTNQWRTRLFIDDNLPSNVRLLHAFTNGFQGAILNNAFKNNGFLVLDARNDENNVEFYRNSQFSSFVEYSKRIVQQVENGAISSDDVAQIPYPVLVLGITCCPKDRLKDFYAKFPFENVHEALRKCVHFTTSSSQLVPANIRRVLDRRDHLQSLSEYPLIACLAKFVEQHGRLPVVPSLIPDIETNTENYNEICACFSQQYERDFAFFRKTLPSSIVDSKIAHFIKQCPFMHYIEPVKERTYNSALQLFYSTERFVQTYKRPPGIEDELLSADLAHFKILLSSSATSSCSDAQVSEWVGYGNVQLPTTATVLGAIACQEIIKIISHVFIPYHQRSLVVNLSEGIQVLNE